MRTGEQLSIKPMLSLQQIEPPLREMLEAVAAELRAFWEPAIKIADVRGAPEVLKSCGAALNESSNTSRKGRSIAPQKLISAARSLEQSGYGILVLTDQELTPPSGWQYIIWHRDDNDAVVTTAPLDPRSWSSVKALTKEEEQFPMAFLKQRIRSACLGVIGELAGLNRCDDDECVMYGHIDFVDVLDGMCYLRQHHRDDSPRSGTVVNRGFEFKYSQPVSAVESVKLYSTPRKEKAA
jgi:predicted Zn-dependent protease